MNGLLCEIENIPKQKHKFIRIGVLIYKIGIVIIKAPYIFLKYKYEKEKIKRQDKK